MPDGKYDTHKMPDGEAPSQKELDDRDELIKIKYLLNCLIEQRVIVNDEMSQHRNA
jgi:hypothetical protein